MHIFVVEYFKKQGFSQDVRISKKIHQEYIKHYQGAILMHCELNPKIIYTQLTSVIRIQKEVRNALCKLCDYTLMENYFTMYININLTIAIEIIFNFNLSNSIYHNSFNNYFINFEIIKKTIESIFKI